MPVFFWGGGRGRGMTGAGEEEVWGEGPGSAPPPSVNVFHFNPGLKPILLLTVGDAGRRGL